MKLYELALERDNEIVASAMFDSIDDVYAYINNTLPYETSDTKVYIDEVDSRTFEILSQDVFTWEDDDLYVENIYTAKIKY